MGLGNESMVFLVRIIIDDLNDYLSERERSLSGAVYNTLSVWLEYIDDASKVDKEIIINEIHKSLGEMSACKYDQHEHNEIAKRIYRYFSEFYGTEDHIKNFATVLVNYYKREAKTEFNF